MIIPGEGPKRSLSLVLIEIASAVFYFVRKGGEPYGYQRKKADADRAAATRWEISPRERELIQSLG